MVAFLILLLFAIIFMVAGGVLLYFRGRTRQKTGLMQQTETSNAADVPGLSPGALVEVTGTLRCEEPITSEMAGRTCAYYRATITREYLESDHNDDDAGSDRRSEVLSQTEQFAPFSVEDSTGSVRIRPRGAEVDAEQVVDRFERNTGNEGPSISLGGATLHIGRGERTLGYRYTESILPVDAPVYVLGTLQENGEIGAPPPGNKEQRFIVSYQSEESLGHSLGRTALWLGVGGIGAIIVGVALLVISVVVLAS